MERVVAGGPCAFGVARIPETPSAASVQLFLLHKLHRPRGSRAPIGKESYDRDSDRSQGSWTEEDKWG